MNLDSRGLPGITIVTEAFRDALDTQAQALGFDPAVVYVPHPIQNRTADELEKIADDAIGPALMLLRKSGSE